MKVEKEEDDVEKTTRLIVHLTHELVVFFPLFVFYLHVFYKSFVAFHLRSFVQLLWKHDIDIYIYFPFTVQWLWSSFEWWSIDEKLSATFNVDLSHFQSNQIPRIQTNTNHKNMHSHTHILYARARSNASTYCRKKKIYLITMTYEIFDARKCANNTKRKKGKKEKAKQKRGELVCEWVMTLLSHRDQFHWIAYSFRSDIDKGDYRMRAARIIECEITILLLSICFITLPLTFLTICRFVVDEI